MDKSKEKEEQSIMDKSMRSVFGRYLLNAFVSYVIIKWN